jgi:hypothetical protein
MTTLFIPGGKALPHRGLFFSVPEKECVMFERILGASQTVGGTMVWILLAGYGWRLKRFKQCLGLVTLPRPGQSVRLEGQAGERPPPSESS